MGKVITTKVESCTICTISNIAFTVAAAAAIVLIVCQVAHRFKQNAA